MSFDLESDRKRIADLEKTLSEVLDSDLNSTGGNDLSLINGTYGNRNAASGDSGGVRSNQPINHNITDVDEDDVSTGIFDKINIISSMAIIDHTSASIDLRIIQGFVKEGTRIKITPKIGKTITLKTGGNILVTADTVILDNEFSELVKHSEAETGVTGGAFKVTKAGAPGIGDNLGDHTATQALQMEDNAIFLDSALQQSIIALALATNYIVPASGAHDFFVNDTVTPKFGITEFSVESNIDLHMNSQDIIEVDRLQFIQDAGALISVANPTIYVDGIGAGDLVINNVDTEAIIFTHSNVIGLQETPTVLQKQGDNSNQFIRLVNLKDPIATGDLGAFEISALTSGSGQLTMAFFSGRIEVITGSGRGSAAIGVNLDGVQTNFIAFNESNNDLIDIFKDLDVNSSDVINVDRLQFIQDAGALISVDNPTIYVDGIGDGDLVINNIDTEAIIFTHSNVIGLQTTPTVLQKQGVDSNQFIRLVNTFSTPAIGALGAFEISGVNDTPTQLTMAFFGGSIVDITSNGSGSAQIGVAVNGVQIDFIRVNDANDGNIKFLSDLDMTDNFIQFSEIALPSDPPTDTGIIYVRDVAGVSTPFFLDSVGTETSMIAAGGTSNQIIDGDTRVLVVDSIPAISFDLDGITVSTLSNVEWLIGKDIDIDSNDLLNPQNIILANGFQITNTSSTTTTFAVPSGEFLSITEGGEIRILVEDDIIISCDTSDDILFQEEGVTVGKYDGGTNTWEFNPGTEISLQIASTEKVQITSTGVTIRDELIMQGDVDFDFGDTVDFNASQSGVGSSGIADNTPNSPDAYIIVRINGVDKGIPAYATS